MERSTVMLKSLVCLIFLNKILAAPTSFNDTQINNSIAGGNRTGIFSGEKSVGSFVTAPDISQLSHEDAEKSKKYISGRKLDSTVGKKQVHNSAYPFTFEETHLSNALISSISILKDINGDADFNVKLNQPSSNTSSTIRIINHIHSGNKTNNVKNVKESKDITDKILNNTFDSILSKPISSDVTENGRLVHKSKRIIPNRTLSGTETSKNSESVLSISRKSSINVNDSDKLSIENDSVTRQTTFINDTGLKEESEFSRRKGKILKTERLPTESESGSFKAGHDSRATSQGHVESKNSHVTHNSTNYESDSYESLQGRSIPLKYEINKNSLIVESNNNSTYTQGKQEDRYFDSFSNKTHKNTTNDLEAAGEIKQSLSNSNKFSEENNKYSDQINTRLNGLPLPNENKQTALERELIALNVFKKLSELNDINQNSGDNTDDDYFSIKSGSGPSPKISLGTMKQSELTNKPVSLAQNVDKFPIDLAAKQKTINNGLKGSEQNQNNANVSNTNIFAFPDFRDQPNVMKGARRNITDVNTNNSNNINDGTINSSLAVGLPSANTRRRGSIKFNSSLSASGDSGNRGVDRFALKPSSNRPIRRKIEQSNENKKETSVDEEIVKGNYPESFKKFSFTNSINKNDQESTKYKENFQKFDSDLIFQPDLSSYNNTPLRNRPIRRRTDLNIVKSTSESSNNPDIKNNHEFNNSADFLNNTDSKIDSSNSKSPSNRPSRRRNNQNIVSDESESSLGVGMENKNIPNTLNSQSNSINQHNLESTKTEDDLPNSSNLRNRPSRRRTIQKIASNEQESIIQINSGTENYPSAEKLHESDQGGNVEKNNASIHSAVVSQENIITKKIVRTRIRSRLTKNEQNTSDSSINADPHITNDPIGKNLQRDLVNENFKNYQDTNSFRRQHTAKSFTENLPEEETSTRNAVTPYQDNDQVGKVTKLQWIKITSPSTNEENLEIQEANYLSRNAKTQIHSRNNQINSNENSTNIHESVTVQSAGDSKFYRIATTAATDTQSTTDRMYSQNNNAYSQNVGYNSETSTIPSPREKYGSTLINNDYLRKEAEVPFFLEPPKDTILSPKGKDHFPIMTQTILPFEKTLVYDKDTANIDLTTYQKPTSTFSGKKYLPNSNITLNKQSSENIRNDVLAEEIIDTQSSKETSDTNSSLDTSSINEQKYPTTQRQTNLIIQKVSETTENKNISQSEDAYHILNEFYLDGSLKEEDVKSKKRVNEIKKNVDVNDTTINLENNPLNINTTRGAQKHTPSKFETISPFTSDSHTNKIYAENTLTTETQSAFVSTQARRKEKLPSETTQSTEQTDPIFPTIRNFSRKPQKEENRTSQRREQQDVNLRVTNIKENSEGKSSFRRNRGSIKYVYDPLNPDFIYGDGNYPSQFSYNYKTPTGIAAYQKGELKEINEQKVFIIHGSYKYTSPDGTPVLVSYIADENGFHPQETVLNDENFKSAEVQTGSQDFYKEINKRKAKTIRAKQNQNLEIETNKNHTLEEEVTRQFINVTESAKSSDDEIKHFTDKIKTSSRGQHTNSTTASPVLDKPDATKNMNNVNENLKQIVESV